MLAAAVGLGDGADAPPGLWGTPGRMISFMTKTKGRTPQGCALSQRYVVSCVCVVSLVAYKDRR
jgi:hypothetical protein